MVSSWDQNIFKPLFVVFLLIPVTVLLILALGTQWAWPEVLPKHWTLSNWNRASGSEQQLYAGFFTSLAIASSVALSATLFGFLTSRSIAYAKHGNRWLISAYSPYVISPILYAIWIHIFFVRGNLAGTLAGVLIGQFLLAYPYSVIFFQGFWTRKIKAYEELSATLGSSFRKTQLKVILPMATGMITVCLFQCFLISWFEFGLTSLIGVGKIKTLPIMVYTFVQEANIHLAAVASLMLVLPIFAISYFRRSWILKR